MSGVGAKWPELGATEVLQAVFDSDPSIHWNQPHLGYQEDPHTLPR